MNVLRIVIVLKHYVKLYVIEKIYAREL